MPSMCVCQPYAAIVCSSPSCSCWTCCTCTNALNNTHTKTVPPSSQTLLLSTIYLLALQIIMSAILKPNIRRTNLRTAHVFSSLAYITYRTVCVYQSLFLFLVLWYDKERGRRVAFYAAWVEIFGAALSAITTEWDCRRVWVCATQFYYTPFIQTVLCLYARERVRVCVIPRLPRLPRQKRKTITTLAAASLASEEEWNRELWTVTVLYVCVFILYDYSKSNEREK